MKTSPCPKLPRPPDIMRAQCPGSGAKPINYLSDYLWKFNNALFRNFSGMFLDMRYGAPHFDDDRTTDCGEMKFDASNLTMNICGTEYTHSIGVYTQTVSRDTISPEFIRRKGEGVFCADSWTEYSSSPTYSAETFAGSSISIILLRQSDMSGTHTAWSTKYYLNFDTSAVDVNPTSATLRICIDTFNKSAGLDDPTLQVYSQNWGDTVDVTDRTGGSLVASQVISESDEGTLNLDVGVDSVNVGGNTKYRLTFEEIENGTNIGCNEYISIHVGQVHTVWERLILGYGA